MISLGEAAGPQPWPITHLWVIKRCTWQMGMQPPMFSSYLESAFGYAFPCGFGIYSELHQRKFSVLFKIHNYDEHFTYWADTWTQFYLVRLGLSGYLWLPLLSTLSWRVFPRSLGWESSANLPVALAGAVSLISHCSGHKDGLRPNWAN